MLRKNDKNNKGHKKSGFFGFGLRKNSSDKNKRKSSSKIIAKIFDRVTKINPEKMTQEDSELLAALIKAKPDKNFFDAVDPRFKEPVNYVLSLPKKGKLGRVIKQKIKLTKMLVRFERKKNDSDEKYRYAVCDPKPLGEGTEGVVYQSRGTIYLDDDHQAKYKEKIGEKIRVIKIYAPSKDEGDDDRKQDEKAWVESGFMFNMKMFHNKKPIFTKNNSRAAVISRKFPGKEFFDLLVEDIGELDKHDCQIKGTGNIFSVDQRLDLTIMLLTQLQKQVHDNAIVHRDIKPENMLVDLGRDNKNNVTAIKAVKYIDFGLSKMENQDDVGDAIGSPDYAPPESFAAAGTTVKSDVYSLTKCLKYIWEPLANKRYGSLSWDQKQKIKSILTSGVEKSASDRPEVMEMCSVFSEIKSELAVPADKRGFSFSM